MLVGGDEFAGGNARTDESGIGACAGVVALILVDTNILIYANGANHPAKDASVAFLTRVASGDTDAAIDAEVLREMLHRYSAMKRWADGPRVFGLARQLFPQVIAITGEVLDEARKMLAARDAVHAAVVVVYKLEGICSLDTDFDGIPGCRRSSP